MCLCVELLLELGVLDLGLDTTGVKSGPVDVARDHCDEEWRVESGDWRVMLGVTILDTQRRDVKETREK